VLSGIHGRKKGKKEKQDAFNVLHLIVVVSMVL